MAAPLPAAWHGAYQPPPCRVEPFGPGKGNGLVAARAIAEGEIIFTETPRVCASLSELPHCSHCARSLAPPLPGLPEESLQHWPAPPAITCPCCAAKYCSEQCCATAAGSYHAVLCQLPLEAVAAAPEVVRQDLLAYYADDDGGGDGTDALPMPRLPLAVPASGPALVATAKLQAYCEGFLGGALDKCAVFPLMALKLVAMAVHRRRTDAEPLQSFEAALVGPQLDPWGLYAQAMEVLPVAMDTHTIWELIVSAVGMSDEEQDWAGGKEAIQLVLAVLFSNGIKITPQSPFDVYMGRVRREGNEERRASVLTAVQQLVKDHCHQRQEQHGKAADAAADGDGCDATLDHPVVEVARGDMDDLLRSMCGVSVGALYATHSKINHSCDFNAQVEGYHHQNSLIQVSTQPTPHHSHFTLVLCACISIQTSTDT